MAQLKLKNQRCCTNRTGKRSYLEYFENLKERLEWIKQQAGAISTGWKGIDQKLRWAEQRRNDIQEGFLWRR